MKITNEFYIDFAGLNGYEFFIDGYATHDVGSEKGTYSQPPASWCDLQEVDITKIQITSDDGTELKVNAFMRKFVVNYFEDRITSKVEEFLDGFDFEEDELNPVWDDPCAEW